MYKVLLVDDEMSAKRSIRNIIAAEIPEFEVVGEAEDGLEAIEMIHELCPNLVITDIRMPVMDGLKLVEKIKQTEESIEVVIVSGFNNFEYAQQAVKFGVTDYLLKPIKPEDVHAMIARIQDKYKRKRKVLIENHEKMFLYKSNLERLTKHVWLLCVEGVQSELQTLHKLFQRDHPVLSALKEMYLQAFAFIITEIDHLSSRHHIGFSDYNCMETDNTEEAVYQKMRSMLYRIMDDIREHRNWGSHKTVNMAVEYINKRYNEATLSLHEVADQVGMSPNYFSKCFKEEVGLSYIDYLMKLRMEKAMELLNDPETKVYEVAYAVGYSEYSRFAKNFKNYYMMSPKDYRLNMIII